MIYNSRYDIKKSKVFIKSVLFILIVLICVTSVQAKKQQNLNLCDAIQIALDHNKELEVVQYNVDLAKAKLTIASQLTNPRLTMENTNDKLFKNEGEYMSLVGISQEFPVASRISKQENVAIVDIAIATEEINEAKRKLKSEVANQFFELLVINRRLKQIDKLVSINQKIVNTVQNRSKEAEVSEFDVNTANLEHQRILQEKGLLTSQKQLQETKLNNLLGRSAGAPLEIDETLPSLSQSLPNPDENQYLQNRPDFKAAWLMLNRAEADQELALAERWADWQISAGVEQSKLVIDGAPPQQKTRAVKVGLTIPLPLLNGNEGRIQEAHSSELKSRAKIQSMMLSIKNEIAQAHGQVMAFRVNLESFKANSINLSTRNLELAQKAYGAGQISILDLVQSQRQQNDIQTTYLNSLSQYLQALVNLYTATGGDFDAIVDSCSSKRKHNK
jgi:cobalt-zinc-cadmium efflux system outer membrane protein